MSHSLPNESDTQTTSVETRRQVQPTSPATMAPLASVFCSFAILTVVLINISDAYISMTVSPAEIKLGATSTMNITCKFPKEDNSTWVEVNSITLYRTRLVYTQKTLAVLTKSNPDVKVQADAKFSATGVLTQTGESFLTLSWENPTPDEVGEYVCQVWGVDQNEDLLWDTAKVSVEGDVVHYLLEKIDMIEKYIANMENSTSNVEEIIKPVERLLPMIFIGSYRGKFYYLSREEIAEFRFSDYLKICQSYGGQLLEINDEKEDKAIKEFLAAVNGVEWVMIGGTDKASEGDWVFPSTNQPMTYTNWVSGHPKTDTHQNCLWLKGDDSWKMYSDGCDFSTPEPSWRYMCEIPRQ